MPFLWFALGTLLGALAMMPVVRILRRRAEYRARVAERRARDAERLAELGSMTGGLAHEIKNPLSTVGLNAQLLAEDLADAGLPDDERDRLLKRLHALAREVDRLGDILKDFLQFAGRMKLDPSVESVVDVVGEVCDFFDPQCRQAGVIMRRLLPDGGALAPIDVGLFKQALLNLMINATQAMTRTRGEDDPPGELIIRVDRLGDEVLVHVTDTGPGIDAEKLEEIFHPYVSYSPGGTGLGLPTSRRIVEEHGGRLEVHSTVDRGSDFVIRVPAADSMR